MNTWAALLAQSRAVFHAPSFAIFTDLITGWVCTPGRRTITAMITVADPIGARAHDAYHRFVHDGVWNMSLNPPFLLVPVAGRNDEMPC